MKQGVKEFRARQFAVNGDPEKRGLAPSAVPVPFFLLRTTHRPFGLIISHNEQQIRSIISMGNGNG